MADYYEASIRVPNKFITDELLFKIGEDCINEPDEINNFYGSPHVTGFNEDEVRYGVFATAEAFCIANRIPFDRYTHADAGGDHYIKYFRPHPTDKSKDIEKDLECNSDEEHYIREKSIEDVINKLFAGEVSRQDTIDLLQKEMREYTPTAIEPLTSFK